MEALFGNDVLAACVIAWLVAQLSKPLIHYVHSRRINLRYFVTAGGITGLSSIAFALAAVFAAVVMYDAAGVRRAVSLQARVLNRMLTEMIEVQHFNEQRLRELIGHTPFEVAVGALLGALAAVSLR